MNSHRGTDGELKNKCVNYNKTIVNINRTRE